MSPKLDRLVPPDFVHVEKYPLRTLAQEEKPERVPGLLGINWYSNFDAPEKDEKGRWWIGRGNLGHVRGGHAVAVKQAGVVDSKGWWLYYDQGEEGACVGFGGSRVMSLLNRMRYDAFWLYRECKKRDGIPNVEGTYVRVALDVLREVGHRKTWWKFSYPEKQEHGIFANRWATSMQEFLDALGMPNASAIPILNSWGTKYPHIVWMPVETADRVIFGEDGEAALVTDR